MVLSIREQCTALCIVEPIRLSNLKYKNLKLKKKEEKKRAEGPYI
jgi:hypothetical protein